MSRVDVITQSDYYGPLNVYNENRPDEFNPGGENSIYERDGRLRRGAQNIIPGLQYVRRSNRLAGIPAREEFIPDKICNGQDDPITLEPINPRDGIRLQCDGTCYSIQNLAAWFRDGNSEMSPKRAPYTQNDKNRIESYINTYGGKKHKKRITRKRKNGKSKKNKKTKSRKSKNKKTKKHN